MSLSDSMYSLYASLYSTVPSLNQLPAFEHHSIHYNYSAVFLDSHDPKEAIESENVEVLILYVLVR